MGEGAGEGGRGKGEGGRGKGDGRWEMGEGRWEMGAELGLMCRNGKEERTRVFVATCDLAMASAVSSQSASHVPLSAKRH